MNVNVRLLKFTMLPMLIGAWSNLGFADSVPGNDFADKSPIWMDSWSGGAVTIRTREQRDLFGLAFLPAARQSPGDIGGHMVYSIAISKPSVQNRLDAGSSEVRMKSAWLSVPEDHSGAAENWILEMNLSEPPPSPNPLIPIPEPSSATLLLMGLAAASGLRMRG